jgi:hypothetical protein
MGEQEWQVIATHPGSSTVNRAEGRFKEVSAPVDLCETKAQHCVEGMHR